MRLVTLQFLSKSYRLGETSIDALKSINLTLNEGEFTAVVGTSGSGKSTLLNMIGCIDSPDSGSVIINEVPIEKLNDAQKSRLRNQNIGFIFQSFNLIPVLNVYENIELPLLINDKFAKEERRTLVENAARDVGLESYLQHRPDQLSGGQRQRVAIARALAGKPQLVLADEPTANLDSKTSEMIIDLMIEMNAKHGVTFLFSTHDERLMKKVSRILHIKDGQLSP